MNVISLDKASSGLRRRVVRSRRFAKLSHDRAVGELLDDLVSYLDLEAVIEESHSDPFGVRRPTRLPASRQRSA